MIENSDLRLMILGCFRYSLGRMTYMPSTTVSVIINNKELFNASDWQRFKDEINAEKNLGSKCDIATWRRLLSFSQEQLKLLEDSG